MGTCERLRTRGVEAVAVPTISIKCAGHNMTVSGCFEMEGLLSLLFR